MVRKYDDYKALIDEHLLDFIPSVDNKSISLYDSMKYSLIAGGKRLRPVLCLAACEFAGGSINDALPYAIAIEYIHTYSLIHDDLPAMDNDDYRRGKLTNHKIYGDAIAILAGDGLLTTAFDAMAKDMLMYLDDSRQTTKRIKAMYEIAKGAGVKGMVAGQVSDIESEKTRVSNEMLEYIHINKTGALIKSAILSGLYMGNARPGVLDDFSIFSENLGLAFQISDDILDETGDEAEMGKAAHHDITTNKNTYTSLNGLEKAYQRLDELIENASSILEKYGEDSIFFTEIASKVKTRRA